MPFLPFGWRSIRKYLVYDSVELSPSKMPLSDLARPCGAGALWGHARLVAWRRKAFLWNQQKIGVQLERQFRKIPIIFYLQKDAILLDLVNTMRFRSGEPHAYMATCWSCRYPTLGHFMATQGFQPLTALRKQSSDLKPLDDPYKRAARE